MVAAESRRKRNVVENDRQEIASAGGQSVVCVGGNRLQLGPAGSFCGDQPPSSTKSG